MVTTDKSPDDTETTVDPDELALDEPATDDADESDDPELAPEAA